MQSIRPNGRDHLKDLGVDERIILKWMFVDWIYLIIGGIFRD
jgi:hypothetical protein